jgi:hypothetical protein
MQSALVAQLFLQTLVPQRYGMQLDVVGAAQEPVPVQCDTGDNVDPVQVVLPHATLLAACAHPPAPSQMPVFPHGGVGVHAASELPAPSLAQLPRLPITLQDWHVGQLPTPQQMPSVQNPDAHSFALPHTAPVAFLDRQLPPAPEQK